jgi:hypothetical protein
MPRCNTDALVNIAQFIKKSTIVGVVRLQAGALLGDRGVPDWTREKLVGRDPSSVPTLQGHSANRALKASDLAARSHRLCSAVNRATLTGSVM